MIFDPGGPWVWRLNSKSGRGPKLSFHHWGHFQRKFQARPNHFLFHNLNVLTTVVDFISKTWFVLIFLSWMFQAGKREHSVQLGRWRWKVATRCMTPVSEICVFETKTYKTKPSATDQRVLGLLRTQEVQSPPPSPPVRYWKEQIPSEIEVILRYKQLTLFTLFILFTLL